MANYQNNMRYGRQGSMRQSRQMPGMHTGCHNPAPQMDTCCGASEPAAQMDMRQRGENGCGCSTPAAESRDTERRERNASRGCGCRREDPLYGMPLAMAYVPWQNWREIYDLCEGFQTGTIFEELDKPFLGRGGWKR